MSVLIHTSMVQLITVQFRLSRIKLMLCVPVFILILVNDVRSQVIHVVEAQKVEYRCCECNLSHCAVSVDERPYIISCPCVETHLDQHCDRHSNDVVVTHECLDYREW
jgi:hypothetical protein